MAAVDQSEFQGAITLLEARGMIGVKKGKETRLNKVSTLKTFIVFDWHSVETGLNASA